jgi:hypothetical protein
MPEPLDEEGRSPPGGEDARRRGKAAAPRGPRSGKRPRSADHGRIDCEIHEGVPTVHGKARAHYATGQSGGRMLVFERGAGERIRIDDKTEVVILEVAGNQVKVAVETVGEGKPDKKVAEKKAKDAKNP